MRMATRGKGACGGVAGGTRPRWAWAWLVAGCVMLLASTGAAGGPAATNYWPVYDDRTDPLDGSRVQGSLGPIFMSDRSADGTVEELAIRPFFFRRENRARQQEEWEALYPLVRYRRDEATWELNIIELFNTRGDGERSADREEKTDFFPFYFSGRTPEGEEYSAVLPFGGRVKNRLGWDEAEFTMFPLYFRFVKQGRETTWTPWPIFSRVGGDSTGFRLFPLYGQEEKPGVYVKRFALWPLILHQRLGLDSEQPEETLAILPLYVGQRSKEQDRFQVLWPFFAYTDNRAQRYEEWDLPWPIIKIARGEGRQITRLFPLFSFEERHAYHEMLFRERHSRDMFLLFPLYMRSEEEIPGSRKVRDRVLWYLYSDTREEGRDGSTRRVDAWPFLRYERDREGSVTLQTLALLEAFLPGNEWVERNYSPLWSVYTYRRNPAGDAVYSFLWNLVRHEETVAGRTTVELLGPVLSYQEAERESHLSLLGGLIDYDVAGGHRTVRLGGQILLSWEDVPQMIATRETEGSGR